MTQRMSEERENELVKRAKAGDKDAFGSLMWQYRWLVTKVARGVLDGHSKNVSWDAEEIVQDTFLYAWQHIGEYTPGRFYRWLWTLTKNRALNMRAKCWHESQRFVPLITNKLPGGPGGYDWLPADSEEAAEYLYSANWEGDQDPIDEDTARIIRHATDPFPKWGDLTRTQAQDWAMYADGMKPGEIAKKTGRDIAAIRQSLARAKKKVKNVTVLEP